MAQQVGLALTVPFTKGFKLVLWNFTEASRGKAAHDGVGGALENHAHSLVAYGTEIPNDAAFFENLLRLTEENFAKCGELVPPSLKSVPETNREGVVLFGRHQPLPSSSSARNVCVVPEIWAKYKKKTK